MKKEETIKIRLDKEEKDRLKKITDKDNKTMSEWVRDKIKKEK